MNGANKGLVIAIIALAVVLAVVGTSWVWLQLDHRMQGGEGTRPERIERAPDPKYVQIGPMTVNLGSDNFSQRLLYLGVSLRVLDEDTQDLIQRHMPEVKNRMLLLLSEYSADELLSHGGKQRLASDIVELFEEPLTEPQPPLAIRSVLFTDFIIQ